jgi:hypothetical protein
MTATQRLLDSTEVGVAHRSVGHARRYHGAQGARVLGAVLPGSGSTGATYSAFALPYKRNGGVILAIICGHQALMEYAMQCINMRSSNARYLA